MPNRAATFVSAIVASFLAAVPLAASRGATPAADNCLAGPKDQAPQGSHWHYRIEHPSNRHCWYLRGEQAAASTASASASSSSTSPAPSAAIPGSVANAHAELTSPQPRGDQDAGIVTGQIPVAAGPVASVDNAAPAKARDGNMLGSVVASRWPDQLAANTPAVSAPAADNTSAGAPANAATPEPSAAAVVPLTSADAPPAKQSSSIQMLLIAIVGALSVAGLAASAVGFGGRRKKRARPIEGERRAIWETALADGPPSSPFPATSRPQLGLPKELHQADDPDDKIAEMLLRLARSARA